MIKKFIYLFGIMFANQLVGAMLVFIFANMIEPNLFLIILLLLLQVIVFWSGLGIMLSRPTKDVPDKGNHTAKDE